MIYRLDGGDKSTKITFLDKYDETILAIIQK